VLIRYADDLVAICHSREQAEQVKARLAGWLAPKGLVFNEDKTSIVHLSEGVDFLGFNIRRYPNGKLLIKPSKQAIRRIRERLAAEMRSLRGANAIAVIRRFNPILRGWAAYYRSVVSKEVFSTVDDHMWQLTHRWARRTHPNKPISWVIARYYGQFNPSRQDTGCSATATAASTWSEQPGQRSFAIGWSQAPRHPTTLRSSDTGHNGNADRLRRHWTPPPCGC
jgi:RNA-directed DNA polymerase